MELKELIESGLKYIEFQDADSQIEITIDLLIKIRMFLFSKSADWYSEKFHEAYLYDIGDTRNTDDAYYSVDGLSYYVDEKMNFKSCDLFHNKNKNCEFSDSCPRFTYHLNKSRKKVNGEWIKRYIYYYINEIDHFFTYCIDLFLSGENIGNFNKIKDNGLLLIYNVIQQKGKKE